MRSLICIAMGLAACQAATSSQEQPLLTPAAGILLTNGTSTFNATQVGSTSNTLTFAVHTSLNNSSVTINSFSYSCPDYTITATLPGYAYRTCETTCFTEGYICPIGQICTDDDYYFTAVFHPSVAASTSCVVTANTTNGSPTLTLYGTGTPPPIHVTAGPGSINFGGVRVNTASTGVGVTITNSGGSAATINSVTASAGFTVAGNTGSHGLAAGTSEGVTVACHPTATGTLDGTLNISNNDTTNGSINIGLSCSGIDSALAIAPSPAVLPTIRTGDSESQNITVTNTGAAATSIQNVMVTGFDMVSAPPAGTMLAANGGQATVTVSYSPTAKGDVAGMLHIDYDNGKTIDTPIAAKAVTTSLSLTPDGNVELGPICIGQTHSQQFSLIAADEGSFKLTGVTMPDATTGFTLTAPTLPATVQGSAANTVKLTIAAAPTMDGDLNSSFVLSTDIPMADPHTINLHMLGLSAGVNGPPLVDLGGNLINQTSLGQHVQISNCTDSPVTITSVNISGTDAADFAVVDQPMDLTIMPAESIQWLVVLDPHSGGDKSAQFNAIFDGGTTVVPLIGEGLTDMLPPQDDAGTNKSSYYACNVGSPSALFPIGLALGGLLVRRRRRPHRRV
ncbi:MAG: choice-of-anchor D domain-containing protein [Deltaproteobacteria bacterium]